LEAGTGITPPAQCDDNYRTNNKINTRDDKESCSPRAEKSEAPSAGTINYVTLVMYKDKVMTTFTVTILCHSDGQSELGCIGQLFENRSVIKTRRSHHDIAIGASFRTKM
jgi:hypothetical protein